MSDDPMRAIEEDVIGCAAAHQRLHASLDEADEQGVLDPRAPSLLPDWSVGHVLTHIARNADALRFMIEGAVLGEQRLMYPSAEHRTADIEAGADRSASDLVDDVRRSSWALESSWAHIDKAAWDGAGITRIGLVPVSSFPWRRWREVEVHQSDLGLPGFGPADWSAEYVAADLDRLLSDREADGDELPPSVAAAEPWQRLAWLLGRDPGPGFPPPPTF